MEKAQHATKTDKNYRILNVYATCQRNWLSDRAVRGDKCSFVRKTYRNDPKIPKYPFFTI